MEDTPSKNLAEDSLPHHQCASEVFPPNAIQNTFSNIGCFVFRLLLSGITPFYDKFWQHQWPPIVLNFTKKRISVLLDSSTNRVETKRVKISLAVVQRLQGIAGVPTHGLYVFVKVRVIQDVWESIYPLQNYR